MKYVVALLIVFCIIGCRTKKECCHSESKVVQVVDSTNVPGYNPSQRALAIYILSLSEKERQEWRRNEFILRFTGNQNYRPRITFTNAQIVPC